MRLRARESGVQDEDKEEGGRGEANPLTNATDMPLGRRGDSALFGGGVSVRSRRPGPRKPWVDQGTAWTSAARKRSVSRIGRYPAIGGDSLAQAPARPVASHVAPFAPGAPLARPLSDPRRAPLCPHRGATA